LICRAPDDAPVKAKMQHASTKDFFRSMLDGLAVEMHATDKADLGEDILREKVKNTVAKK
jgi:cofilin